VFTVVEGVLAIHKLSFFGYKQCIMRSSEFRTLVNIFTSSNDVDIHRQAIISLLDPLDLDIEFNKLCSKNILLKVRSIFASFAEAEEDVYIPEEEAFRLEQIGRLTCEYFDQQAYDRFAQMIYHVVLETFFEHYDFGVSHISQLNTEILYAVIPEEIQLQTLLLETMASPEIFNWHRSEKIIEHSLLVLTVCFSDIYSFLTENDDDMILD